MLLKRESEFGTKGSFVFRGPSEDRKSIKKKIVDSSHA
jgi:hypothetical protein